MPWRHQNAELPVPEGSTSARRAAVAVPLQRRMAYLTPKRQCERGFLAQGITEQHWRTTDYALESAGAVGTRMLSGSDGTLLHGSSADTSTRRMRPVLRTIAESSVKQACECVTLCAHRSRCCRKMPPADAAQLAALSERLRIAAGQAPGQAPGCRAQPPGGQLQDAEALERALLRRSDRLGERSWIAAGENRPSGPSIGFRRVYSSPGKPPGSPVPRLVHALLQ